MQVAAFVILIVLQGFILISLWTIPYQAVKQEGRLLRLDELDHHLTQAGLGAGPGRRPVRVGSRWALWYHACPTWTGC